MFHYKEAAMKRSTKIIWGIILIAAGIIFALNSLEIANIDVFFDGWWTLFIIVPCVIGLFNDKNKIDNLIGIAVGVFLLLCCRDVLSFDMLWKLILPILIVIVGLRLIFGGIFSNKENEKIISVKTNTNTSKKGVAVFSGSEINYDGEIFEDAELIAVFGGVTCDLRRAIIEKDCEIEAIAIFGGIDILVPNDVNVEVSSVGVFGGVDNKTSHKDNAPTIHISAISIFGGIDIE